VTIIAINIGIGFAFFWGGFDIYFLPV